MPMTACISITASPAATALDPASRRRSRRFARATRSSSPSSTGSPRWASASSHPVHVCPWPTDAARAVRSGDHLRPAEDGGRHRAASVRSPRMAIASRTRDAQRACRSGPPRPRAGRTICGGCRTTTPSISRWLVNSRPAPSPRAAPGRARGPAWRCPREPPRARSPEHRRTSPLDDRTARMATYRRNAARVAAAVSLKYSRGLMRPHSLKV